MTHPIPGADSERADFEALFVTILDVPGNPRLFERVSDDRRYCSMEVEYAWLTYRAAPKVGANVAAHIPTWRERVANTYGDGLSERTQRDVSWNYAIAEIADLRRAIAAGAPAETPKPMGYDEFFAEAKRLGCKLPDDMLLPSAAQPSPAPIAGDVEKDAAMREAVCEAIAGQLTGLYHCGRVWSAWSLGIMDEDDFSPAEEDIYIISNIAEAAIAAMLANSSSGEAG